MDFMDSGEINAPKLGIGIASLSEHWKKKQVMEGWEWFGATHALSDWSQNHMGSFVLFNFGHGQTS